MADKNADKRPKDANPRRMRRRLQLQDLPPELRARVTEYFQPNIEQQGELRTTYRIFSRQRSAYNKAKSDEEDPMVLGEMKREMEYRKSNYQKRLEKWTTTPGIWQTYSYFWKDSDPWPDQDFNDKGPITT